MNPLEKSRFCFTHDPSKARARAAARRLGGKNRRRTNGDAPENVTLTTAGDIRRLLERVAVDAFALDNSARRARALTALAMAALKTLEVGGLEERLSALETYVHSTRMT